MADEKLMKLIEQQAAMLSQLTNLFQQQQERSIAPSQQQESTSKAALMDSLANSMTDFIYEPESGLVFQAWYTRYTHVFERDASTMQETDKVALLWRKMSNHVHERFRNYVLPKQPSEMSLRDTVDKLNKLFGKVETEVSQRYKCLQLTKSDSEDFKEYASKVNLQCELFKLSEMQIDQFKCLIFVLGLKSSKDNDIRIRLLKLVDDNKDSINLDKLVDETQKILDIKTDNNLIAHQSNAVCAINKTAHKVPKTACWLCGNLHFVKFCTFKTHKCSVCHQVGHRDNYCKSARSGYTPKSDVNNKNKRDDNNNKNDNKPPQQWVKKEKFRTNAVFSTMRVNFQEFRKYAEVHINNRSVQLQIDTASDISIISISTWEAIGQPDAYTTDDCANDVNTNTIKLLAKFQCDVTIANATKALHCYVTDIDNLNIIGIDWIQQFQLWDTPITAWCRQIKFDDIISTLRNKYRNVFENSTLGLCTKAKVHIQLLPDAKEIYIPKRPVPYAARVDIETELQRLENNGTISPVDTSRWAAPIVVSRRNGKIRICADYSTGLNANIEPNQYPLPTPEEILADCHDKTIFTHLDLSDAYLQVEIDDESKELLTVNTHKGLYKFNRLTPGIKSAPGAFQRIMDQLCAGIDGAKAYIDDIMLASKSVDEHKINLERLLQRIDEFGFRLKFEKCKFFKSEITYLGQVIDKHGTKPEPDKIKAIQHLKTPENISEVRSLLGSINHYGKYVQNMRNLRKPLDDLLKKENVFKWTADCQKSFDDFKRILSSDLLLMHYNPNMPIHVAADASSHGIGAVIYHTFPDNSMKAVHHISRSLTQAEKNYSQIEKEGLALIFAVQRFHKMLFGRKFTLHTDHKPLLSIFGSKKGIPVYTANRLQRWALILLAYNFEIKYTNTLEFGHADVLSRLISTHEKPADDYIIASISLEDDFKQDLNQALSTFPISYKMIIQTTNNDNILQAVIAKINQGWPESRNGLDSQLLPFYNRRDSLSVLDGVIMFNSRIVIPDICHRKILSQLHRGHIGVERSKQIARSYVYWPNIDKDIEDYNRKCNNCQLGAKSPVKTDLCSWPTATRSLERLHIDYAGPVKGKYYLVMVDAHSKYPAIYETTSITTFATVKLLNEFCSQFGNPEQIVSDNGTQFCSGNFESWCQQRGIQHTRTVRFHPSSNGQAERFVDTLKRALKKSDKEGTSAEALQTFLEVYRSTPNPNSPYGLSPAESFIGRKMRTIFDMLVKPPEKSHDRNDSMEAQYNAKHGTKRRSFQPGDLVYAENFKANKSYWVPGEIIEKVGNVVYNTLIEVGGRNITVRSHADQLRLRVASEPPTNETEIPLDILLKEFDITPPTPDDCFHTPPSTPDRGPPRRIATRRNAVEAISRSPSALS